MQPYDATGHLLRTTQSAAPSSSVSFDWQPGSVAFAAGAATPSSWTYTGSDVPVPGDERPHLNLWLFRGSAPADGKPVELIVRSFSFTPA